MAYISNNGYIDGNIHRQMRKTLLSSFDKIYVLNLHGNANLKERHPDGSEDKNVFDIRQGVGIGLFIKSNANSKGATRVYHYDAFGKREKKYDFLSGNSLESIAWRELNPVEPNYFLVPKDFVNEDEYKRGFKIDEAFVSTSTGVKTHRDNFVIGDTREELIERLRKFLDSTISDAQLRETFGLKDNRDWQLHSARLNVTLNAENISRYLYRPFDFRFIYFEKLLIDFSRDAIMSNFLNGSNIGLVLPKQVPDTEFAGALISNSICDHKSFSAYNTNSIFPLYLDPGSDQRALSGLPTRQPNLNRAFLEKFSGNIGLDFSGEKDGGGTFCPLDLLDYIYAVLHSPTYREKYKEFLKIDFPRVPYPENAEEFWQLAALGGELREIHLLESPKVNQFITGYPVSGTNVVDKITYKNANVYINDTQHFTGVPETAWNFYIGGYQPAQKWLKDRKGRSLSYDDILHYQKIIVALTQTARMMNQIDLVKQF